MWLVSHSSWAAQALEQAPRTKGRQGLCVAPQPEHEFRLSRGFLLF